MASDELMGRDPARPEMKLAYTFIATQLENAGAKPLLGQMDFTKTFLSGYLHHRSQVQSK